MANGLLDNLVAYWDHDETSGSVLDVHASFDLSESASIGNVVSGKINSARNYDGRAAEYVGTTGTALDVRKATLTSWTWAGWVKVDTKDASSGHVLAEQYDVGVQGQGWFCLWRTNVDDGVCMAWLNTSGATDLACTAGAVPLSDGSWHLVVAGYNASTNKLFVSADGSTIVEATPAAPMEYRGGAAEFTLGNWPALPRFRDQNLDESGFWGAALTQDQVDALWNSGSALAYSSFDNTPVGGSDDSGPQASEYSDPSPFFTRNLEVTDHLQANFLNTADAPAVINIVYRQVSL